MNINVVEPPAALRLTVASVVIGQIDPQTGYPPVLLVWPTGAACKEEGNLAAIQGGIEPHEELLPAMQRELTEECGLEAQWAGLVDHPRFPVPQRGKEYIWGLLQVDHTLPLTLDPNEVAEAAWYYCPQMLAAGVRQMSPSKAKMFQTVFAMACDQYRKQMGAYVPYVAQVRSRLRKKHQQQVSGVIS